MQTQTSHMGTRLNQCALMNWKKGILTAAVPGVCIPSPGRMFLMAKLFGLAVVMAVLEISHCSLLTWKLENPGDLILTSAFKRH